MTGSNRTGCRAATYQDGLTSSDLKVICNSLVETLQNSFHGRIEYPWQDEERAQAGAVPTPAAAVGQRRDGSGELPLDSADQPRPHRRPAAADHDREKA